MIPLDSPLVLPPRLDPALGVRDITPGAWHVLLSTQGSDWGPSGVQVDASTTSHGTSAMQELSILDRGASLSSPSCYLAASQVDMDIAFGMREYLPVVPDLGLSFSASDNNLPFPSLAQEPDRSRCACPSPEICLGLMLTDALRMDHVLYANDEVVASPSLSAPSATPHTIHHYPLTSSLDQDTEECCETSGSDGFPPMEILRQYLDSADPTASSNFAAWTDNSSDFEEITQMVDFECLSPSAHLPLEQHLIVSGERVRRCKWIDEDGTICDGELTRSTLSGHLSTHGIKSMPRARSTTCKWVGCRRKKPINRESIVRHVREVHLHLKRPYKRARKPRS